MARNWPLTMTSMRGANVRPRANLKYAHTPPTTIASVVTDVPIISTIAFASSKRPAYIFTKVWFKATALIHKAATRMRSGHRLRASYGSREVKLLSQLVRCPSPLRYPVAVDPHPVDPGSAGHRKGRLADRMRPALAVAGGFRVGSAWVDGDGVPVIPDPECPRRRRGLLCLWPRRPARRRAGPPRRRRPGGPRPSERARAARQGRFKDVQKLLPARPLRQTVATVVRSRDLRDRSVSGPV